MVKQVTEISKEEYPWKFVHAACKGVAFYCNEKIEPYSDITSEGKIYPNGEPIPYMGEIICGSCGEKIEFKHLRSVFCMKRY